MAGASPEAYLVALVESVPQVCVYSGLPWLHTHTRTRGSWAQRAGVRQREPLCGAGSSAFILRLRRSGSGGARLVIPPPPTPSRFLFPPGEPGGGARPSPANEGSVEVGPGWIGGGQVLAGVEGGCGWGGGGRGHGLAAEGTNDPGVSDKRAPGKLQPGSVGPLPRRFPHRCRGDVTVGNL